MRRRPVSDDELKWQVRRDLLDFVDVMFFRFEFARGFQNDAYEIFDGSLRHPPLFPRLLRREKFLPTKRGQKKYIDDLRQDLEETGSHKDWAQSQLKHFVEEYACPLCYAENVTTYPRTDSFFPSTLDARDLSWVREYCFQLFELQDYLIREQGVRPGSLLPVWVSHEPEAVGDAPVVSFLPVRQGLVEALMRYLIWEYGGWIHEHVSFRGRRGGSRPTRKSRKLLANALRWGRHSIAGQVLIDCFKEDVLPDLVDEGVRDLEGYFKLPRQKRERIEKQHYPNLDTIPTTRAEGMLREFIRTGEKDNYDADTSDGPIARTTSMKPSSRFTMENLGKWHSDEVKMVNDQNIRQEVRKASNLGEELYHGGYKNLW